MAGREVGNRESEVGRGARDVRGRVTRREAVKLAAGAVVAAPMLKDMLQAAPKQAAGKAPLFFTRDEFALVDELTEIIIPTDEHSPGARAAKCAEYIDYRLSEAFDDEPRKVWREGLRAVEALARAMNGKTFMQSSPDERVAVVARMAANEQNPQKPEEKFFAELKGRTAHAYYTSQIGLRQELEYKGNSYQREYAGELPE
jgi:hypothetical protein